MTQTQFDDAIDHLKHLLRTQQVMVLSVPVSAALRDRFGKATGRALPIVFVGSEEGPAFYIPCSAEGDAFGQIAEQGAVSFSLSSFLASDGGIYGVASAEDVTSTAVAETVWLRFEAKYGADFSRSAFSGPGRLFCCRPSYAVSICRGANPGSWVEIGIDLVLKRVLARRTKG